MISNMWDWKQVCRPEFWEDYCFSSLFLSALPSYWAFDQWHWTDRWYSVLSCFCAVKWKSVMFTQSSDWKKSLHRTFEAHHALSFPGILSLSTPLCSNFFCHAGILTIFWYARHAVQSARKVFSKIASSPPSNLCVKVTFSITLSVTVLFKSSNHLPLYTLLIPFAYIVSVLALGAQFF